MHEQHPMAEAARSFAHQEATGRLPDDVYSPSLEDLTDPDHHEMAGLVVEGYARSNESRRVRGLMDENESLRHLLRENGIEVPEGPCRR